jgi:hypothetical protein
LKNYLTENGKRVPMEPAEMKTGRNLIRIWLLMAMLSGLAADAQTFITNTLPTPVAIGVVNSVQITGSGIVTDSYNSQDPTQSTNGYWNGYSGTNGNIASVNGVVNIGNQIINGNLFLGPNASYASSAGQVTGKIFTNANLPFPDVSLPTNDASGNPIIWISAPNTTNGSGKHVTVFHDFTASGYYTITDLLAVIVEPGVTVALDVKTSNWNPVYLNINGGTTNSGNVVLFVESGACTLVGNSVGGPSGNRPANLWCYGLPEITGINLSGNSSFVGVIYAPEATITVNGGGTNFDFIGSVIANSIALNGPYAFHYDESLPLMTNPPVITTQPMSHVVLPGSNVTFGVLFTGIAPLSYYWYFNQTNLLKYGTSYGLANGHNFTWLTLTNVQLTNAGNYSVSVSNTYYGVTSSNATLTVIVPPAITTQPANQVAIAGSNVSFTVLATNSTPATYSWYFNQTNLLASGTNYSSLTLNGVQMTDVGNYQVIVTGAGGSVTSSVATLTVVLPGYNHISGHLLGDGSMQLSFVGIAEENYALDSSVSLSPANWIPQATNQADALGNLIFTNTPNPATNNFWRIRSVP